MNMVRSVNWEVKAEIGEKKVRSKDRKKGGRERERERERERVRETEEGVCVRLQTQHLPSSLR